MEDQLHPDLAYQTGQEVVKTVHDVHPSLVAELQAQPETIETQGESDTEMVENQTNEEETVYEETSQPETAKDRQWKEVKFKADQAKHLQREKEQLERELEFYKNQQPQQTQSDDDDDYSTKKDWRLIEKKQRELEQKLAESEKQNAIARAERQLLEDYPDIREVVSNENIERLKDDYPHLYNSVIASNDVYTVGAAAHEMIMAKGIHKKKPSAINQVTSINRNQSKPKSSSMVSPQHGNDPSSPIKTAHSFMGNNISSEEERKQIFAEMVQYSRNRS